MPRPVFQLEVHNTPPGYANEPFKHAAEPERPDVYTEKENQNAAHLIADRFRGTGEARGLNLGRGQKRGVDPDSAAYGAEFSCRVDIAVGALHDAAMAQTIAPLLSAGGELVTAATVRVVLPPITRHSGSKLKRVVSTSYKSTLSAGVAPVTGASVAGLVMPPFSIGPDLWLAWR